MQINSKMNNEIYKVFSAIKNNRQEVLAELLKNNIKLLNYKNKNHENLFLYACKNDNYEAIKLMLGKKEDLIFSKNIKEQNFLHILTLNNSKKTLKELLDNFPKEYQQFVNGKDKSGNLPLFYLLNFGDNKTINLFLSKIDFSNSIEEENNVKQNALHYLAKNENITINKKFDIFKTTKNKDQEDQNLGYKPVFFAAAYLNKENFKFFYENKNEKNILGQSLLLLSSQNKNIETFNLLLNDFENEVDERLIDLCIDSRNDNKLKILLEKKFKLNEYQIKEIFKNIGEFPDTLDQLLKTDNKEYKDLYFIYEKSNKINKIDIGELEYSTLMPSIINHKKEMIEKIFLLHKNKKGLSDEETNIFFSSIKKLPMQMQIGLLKNKKITEDFNEIIKKQINDYFTFTKNKNKELTDIPDHLLSFYIYFLEENKNEKDFNKVFNQVYLQAKEKKGFFKFFKYFTINEINQLSFLSEKEKVKATAYRLINLLGKESLEENMDLFLQNNKNIFKQSILMTLNFNKPILNDELLKKAKDLDVEIDLEECKSVLMKNTKVSKSFFNILKIDDLNQFNLLLDNHDIPLKSWDIMLSSFKTSKKEIKNIIIKNFIRNNDLNDFNVKNMIEAYFNGYKGEVQAYELLKKEPLAEDIKNLLLLTPKILVRPACKLAKLDVIEFLIDHGYEIKMKDINWGVCDKMFQADISNYLNLLNKIKNDEIEDVFSVLKKEVNNVVLLSHFIKIIDEDNIKKINENDLFEYLEKIYKPFFNLSTLDKLESSPIVVIKSKESKDLYEKIMKADFFEHLNSDERSFVRHQLMNLTVEKKEETIKPKKLKI